MRAGALNPQFPCMAACCLVATQVYKATSNKAEVDQTADVESASTCMKEYLPAVLHGQHNEKSTRILFTLFGMIPRIRFPAASGRWERSMWDCSSMWGAPRSRAARNSSAVLTTVVAAFSIPVRFRERVWRSLAPFAPPPCPRNLPEEGGRTPPTAATKVETSSTFHSRTAGRGDSQAAHILGRLLHNTDR